MHYTPQKNSSMFLVKFLDDVFDGFCIEKRESISNQKQSENIS